MVKQKYHSKEYYFLFALFLGVIVVVPTALLTFKSTKTTQNQPQPTAVVSPTSMQTPIITEIDANTKKVSLREYKISFQVPSEFLYKDYPYSQFSTDTIVRLTSPDEKQTVAGTVTSGVSGEITLIRGWDGFLIDLTKNQPHKVQYTVDNSIFKNITNPLITAQTARAYTNSSRDVDIDIKLDTRSIGGALSRFTMICVDKPVQNKLNDRCPEIETMVLSTIAINK